MTVLGHRTILFKPPQVSVDLTVAESKKETESYATKYLKSRYQPLIQVCYGASISNDNFYVSKQRKWR